jgi:hypothetical protein
MAHKLAAFRVALSSAVIAALIPASSAHVQPSLPPLSITAIQAHLFYSKTGLLSEDILTQDVRLVNIVAASNPSTSTLVKVRIAYANKNNGQAGGTIKIVGTEYDRRTKQTSVVINQTVALIGANEEEGSYIGFWLKDTGCRPIELKVTATLAGKASKKNATLPFVCNE